MKRPPFNHVTIPPATLHSNYFNSERPMYLNFGALGKSVGHEMVHAFDFSALKYVTEDLGDGRKGT